MTFYHGSPVPGLTCLKPFLSEHGKPYLYFAVHPLVALLYAVKPVPKPFSFYPYGFDSKGNPIYSEYYENAFYDIYHGKRGYLYTCYDLPGAENPTQINCAYTVEKPVMPDNAEEIPDLYAYFKKQEEKGVFHIKPRHQISEKEMNMALESLRQNMRQYGLQNLPEHPMSRFLQSHFPDVWKGDAIGE